MAYLLGNQIFSKLTEVNSHICIAEFIGDKKVSVVFSLNDMVTQYTIPYAGTIIDEDNKMRSVKRGDLLAIIPYSYYYFLRK